MADVLTYLVRPADKLGDDLTNAARTKATETANKYPVEKAKGSVRRCPDL